ncbi:MAG: asparagine synthase (glutamine-hydrolyzing) [Pyrinomonadaceae bacterium]
MFTALQLQACFRISIEKHLEGVHPLCGIAGFVSTNEPADVREQIVSQMLLELGHRGPDARALFSSGEATFGVDRLAIVDRADAQQPMVLRNGSREAMIAYNGEVYNFQPLRSRYQALGFKMRTVSDTETVLAAHLAEGVQALEHLDGMFAYGIWHNPERELLLARDRMGIKPLFYVELGDGLLFASEPKAFFCHPAVARRPNLNAVLEYFLHGAAFASGYTTGDRSFFEGIKALPPGHFLRWSAHGGVRTQRYWSPVDELGPLRPNEQAAQEEIKETLTDSVQSMLMGEVPIGSALSGGIDSSWITQIASQAMPQPLVSACITYSANADDPDARHAQLVSSRLNDEQRGCHVLHYTHLSQDNYLDGLDEMVKAFDEPHWELRQLAMFENYRTLAKARRTVVLTGEGADELFFGYYQKFPGFRSNISSPADFADLWRQRLPGVRSLLAPAFASGLMSNGMANDLVDSAVDEYFARAWELTGDRLRTVQVWYLHTFLPWLLMDNDRCSMAHSIEGRFPFLSRKMVSLGLQLPPSWNIGSNGVMREKVLLRRAAATSLPEQIWRDRVKSPLPVPLQKSYHAQIANRLGHEVENAHSSLWEILDREYILKRIENFNVRMSSADDQSGDLLTAYIPLTDEPQVRTAELFAILTFLRWYQMLIVEPRKDSACRKPDHETQAKVFPSQITGSIS